MPHSDTNNCSVLVEFCIESLGDAKIAQAAGADRLELNSALRLGGLTPSIGTLDLIIETMDLPVISMIRPRESGFCYSDCEFETMLRDSASQIRNGAAGIAFGILNTDGTIDLTRSQILIDLAHSNDREAILHRAFDFAPDWRQALDQSIQLGFDRILTSGGKPTAIDGVSRIAECMNQAGDDIEILPASGIRSDHLPWLVQQTLCTQVHASVSVACQDPSLDGSVVSLVDVNRDGNSFRTTDADGAGHLVRTAKQIMY